MDPRCWLAAWVSNKSESDGHLQSGLATTLFTFPRTSRPPEQQRLSKISNQSFTARNTVTSYCLIIRVSDFKTLCSPCLQFSSVLQSTSTSSTSQLWLPTPLIILYILSYFPYMWNTQACCTVRNQQPGQKHSSNLWGCIHDVPFVKLVLNVRLIQTLYSSWHGAAAEP